MRDYGKKIEEKKILNLLLEKLMKKMHDQIKINWKISQKVNEGDKIKKSDLFKKNNEGVEKNKQKNIAGEIFVIF